MKNESKDEVFYLIGFNKCLEDVGEAPGRQENKLLLARVITGVLQKQTMLWTHFLHHHLKRTAAHARRTYVAYWSSVMLRTSSASRLWWMEKQHIPWDLRTVSVLFHREISAPVTRETRPGVSQSVVLMLLLRELCSYHGFFGKQVNMIQFNLTPIW